MNDPKKTVPESLRDLLTTNNLGHLTTVRPDGGLAPSIVWIDFDGEQVLVSTPVGSRKGVNCRANLHVAVSVVDRANPFRYLQIRGRITDIRPDAGLALIDRLALRYIGSEYRDRTGAREVLEIAIDHVRAAGA
jgi:PPOX class probable F420-dependent enzyme